MAEGMFTSLASSWDFQKEYKWCSTASIYGVYSFRVY